MPRIILSYSAPAAVTNMSLECTSLGTYVFGHNPAKVKRIRRKREFLVQETIDSSGIFDWGFLIDQDGYIGGRYDLSWPFMLIAQWSELKDYYEASDVVTWDAREFAHEVGKGYEVEVVNLVGNDMPQNTTYKKDVVLTLEIRKVKTL